MVDYNDDAAMARLEEIERSAKSRVDYRLTYAATAVPRVPHLEGIEGPKIDNAYAAQGSHIDMTDGDWCDPNMVPELPARPNEQHLIDRWFQAAIQECVHEALEWFQVDGRPLLDPHGVHELKVSDLAIEFSRKLTRLSKKGAP